MIMPNTHAPTEMITPEEMNPRCGLSPESIRKALRQGSFPVGMAFHTGKQWRYIVPRAEFEAWLAGEIPSRWDGVINQMAASICEKIKEEAS